ncbi:MAG: aromatic ring hydroxylase [Solirubrobacterales bacterium]|nr:aromatic ring hydroxylase [Solirubrobacterales bacterium]
MREIEVPVLIMGGGGCGLSASSFLSEMGVEHLLVERHSETSHLPKAHYLNQRTMEIFRGFGMADPIYEVGTPVENFGHIRWVTSLGGDGPFDRRDFYEFDAFGGGVLKEPYEKDGPALPSNLPQIRLEPLLRRMAEERSSESVRFNHEIVDWEDTDAGIVATVLDRSTDEKFIVRARYMIAADGGKTVVPKLGIQMLGPTGMLEMVSTHFKADLSEYVDDKSMITWSINPEGEGSWSSGALVKMGPTWDRHSEEWVIHFAFRPDDPARFDEDAIVPRMRELLKIPDLELEVLKVSHWILDRIHAEKFRVGNVFLAGDSAHRQPPTTGLGLNGAIHDAHNLCWKLAEVVQGRADDSLLDSYEAERLPVGADNADWALSAFTNFAVIDVAMGLMPGAPKEQNMAAFAAFFADTRLGASIRARFSEVIRTQRVEFHAHEIEIGYNYDSAAVVPDGTEMPVRDPFGSVYKPTTRPGHRLPHAWIERDGKRLSTHDLITPGTFALIAGADGEEWLKAAATVGDELGVSIDAVSIGGTATDVDGQWAEVGGLEATGAVLVRPDQHTAWRTQELSNDPVADLRSAFGAILGKAAVASA